VSRVGKLGNCAVGHSSYGDIHMSLMPKHTSADEVPILSSQSPEMYASPGTPPCTGTKRTRTTCCGMARRPECVLTRRTSRVVTDKSGGDRYTVSVPCSGSDGPFGIERSYVQPKFVVIEYSVSKGESPRRKKLEIPPRGEARVIYTALP
jgi:hypothetical protein